MKNEIVNYRRQRAKETLEEARIMLDNEKLFAAVNRIYYSIFYEVMALLLTKGLSSSKHTGIRSYFNREFVKPAIIKKEFGRFYNKIFEFRQRGDYEDFVEFSKAEVKQWLDRAEKFIVEIDRIIVKTIKEESKS